MNTDELCRRAGITHRQATYWVKIGLLPERRAYTGPGSRHQWSDADVRSAAVVKAFAGQGCQGNQFADWVWDAATAVRDHSDGYVLIANGNLQWVETAEAVVAARSLSCTNIVIPIGAVTNNTFETDTEAPSQ